MDTWISKRGYPYVTISRNYTTGGAVISQVTLEQGFPSQLLLKTVESLETIPTGREHRQRHGLSLAHPSHLHGQL